MAPIKKLSPKDLSSYELDKWISTCQFILMRKDGRDHLTNEVLHRALRELRWRRRSELHMERILDETVRKLFKLEKADISKILQNLILDSQKKSTMWPIIIREKNWDKEAAAEVAKKDVISKVNDLLKATGYVLILHYDPDDLDKGTPISATIERWEQGGVA